MNPPYGGDQGFDIPPAKRQRVGGSAPIDSPTTGHSRQRSSSIHSLSTIPDDSTVSPRDRTSAPPTKSKRVRTGCLTCRERHLKCDEGTPDCMNCRKSSRQCKRGVRLNFIDVNVQSPQLIPPTADWAVQFQDESRQIASEYMGGLNKYDAHANTILTPPQEPEFENVLRDQRRRISDGTRLSPHTHSPVHPHPARAASLYSLPGSDRLKIEPGFEGKPPRAHLGDDVSTRTSSFLSHSVEYGNRAHDQLAPIKNDPTGYVHIKSEPGAYVPLKVEPIGHLPSGHAKSESGSYGLGIQAQHVAVKSEPSVKSHGHRMSDASSGTVVPTPGLTGTGQPFDESTGNLSAPEGLVSPPLSEKSSDNRAYLSTPDEIFYMQVFVEEVGVWMDSLDKDKHFSQLIPYSSLKSPMLLNAFLACGAKHLTLVNSAYNDDTALSYYDTATTQLLRSLQNPDRNTAECATTAVVLNVYEIMSEKPAQRMSHIAGARALIRECGWDARSTGLGAACFWLNIGMEVLSCLAFNWSTAWDPDQWGVDMNFSPPAPPAGDGTGDDKDEEASGGGGNPVEEGMGQEEVWVHRILYIVGKIANFRAATPKFQVACPHDEQIRLGNRQAEWQELKRLLDSWNNSCPRTMHPFGYMHPPKENGKSASAFPNVWLIKRAAIIGRLFYHTAQCLLAQIQPIEPPRPSSSESVPLNPELHHAQQICGIVAHNKDRGVSSVAIRSLAIAAMVLTDRREQDEVLEIFGRITAQSGWRLQKLLEGLKAAWGRGEVEAEKRDVGGLAAKLFGASVGAGAREMGHGQGHGQGQQQQQQQRATAQHHPPEQVQHHHVSPPHQNMHHQPQHHRTVSHSDSHSHSLIYTHTPTSLPASMPASTPHTPHMMPPTTAAAQSPVASPAPRKPINPLSLGDFSLPNHPYRNWYEPPSRVASFSQPFF